MLIVFHVLFHFKVVVVDDIVRYHPLVVIFVSHSQMCTISYLWQYSQFSKIACLSIINLLPLAGYNFGSTVEVTVKCRYTEHEHSDWGCG